MDTILTIFTRAYLPPVGWWLTPRRFDLFRPWEELCQDSSTQIIVPHKLTFLCFPMTFPLFPMTTAVFHMVSPCALSRSRMGQMTTMPHFRAYRWQNNLSESRGETNETRYRSNKNQSIMASIHALYSCVPLCSHSHALASLCRLGELTPLLLPSAKGKRHRPAIIHMVRTEKA